MSAARPAVVKQAVSSQGCRDSYVELVLLSYIYPCSLYPVVLHLRCCVACQFHWVAH
jgi:hypothetical protein